MLRRVVLLLVLAAFVAGGCGREAVKDGREIASKDRATRSPGHPATVKPETLGRFVAVGGVGAVCQRPASPPEAVHAGDTIWQGSTIRAAEAAVAMSLDGWNLLLFPGGAITLRAGGGLLLLRGGLWVRSTKGAAGHALLRVKTPFGNVTGRGVVEYLAFFDQTLFCAACAGGRLIVSSPGERAMLTRGRAYTRIRTDKGRQCAIRDLELPDSLPVVRRGDRLCLTSSLLPPGVSR